VETIRGIVENITFQNENNTFVVFRIRPQGSLGAIAVVGGFAVPLLGEEVELTGEWVEHARFGRQFKAENCRRIAPTTEKGIERFLASGIIKGIGPSLAARLVAKFGGRTLEIIEFSPHRLAEVDGIGAKKADTIRLAYASQTELRDVMLFLELHGVSGTYGAKIVAAYGAAALDVLRDSPYRLAADVDGIGFRTADQIAQSLGLERDNAERLAAGIQYALLQIAQSGHCCVPDTALVEEAARLLTVEPLEVAGVLRQMINDNQLMVADLSGMELIYPAYLYYAEKKVAERLLDLRDHAKPVHSLDHQGAVTQWEQSAQVRLAEEQRQALISALAHGVLVLTGGPGTGKTTTVRGILAVLEAEGFKIVLGAPTGRAAKRLSEATGREAATIHRLLESAGGREGAPIFARNEQNPVDADVLIVDEVSMMDINLTNHLLRAVPDGCRVILVGDVDQLPAVGPGAVLKDIIRSGAIPVVRLTEVFRQAGESIIVHNAHRINRGLKPDYNVNQDFQFHEFSDSQAAARAIVDLCVNQLPADGFHISSDVQVLSPMHRHDCGVENLNKLLQEAINPAQPEKAEITTAKFIFRQGDKVMQMKNNYTKGVFNGDIGIITAIDNGLVFVRYPDNSIIYESNEVEELHLAYAMSVHKSQGSEYPVVVMPLTDSHYVMLQRNLLYTAVTRAKDRVILVGTKAALNTALSNDRTKRRYSLLAERLRGENLC
jgi:exodeoxyribonuclease V alpha subunit